MGKVLLMINLKSLKETLVNIVTPRAANRIYFN